MGRSFFVQPETMRLNLADVHRRAIEELIATNPKKLSQKDLDKEIESLDAKAQAIEGNYIEVKKRLTVGEQRHIFARMVRDFRPGEQPTLDPTQVGISKVIEYLTAWGGPGFVDEDGRAVKFPKPIASTFKDRESLLSQLHGDVYNDISAAIDWHETEQAREWSEEKNGTDGAKSSAAISPSVV